jgi:hypothetical protein
MLPANTTQIQCCRDDSYNQSTKDQWEKECLSQKPLVHAVVKALFNDKEVCGTQEQIADCLQDLLQKNYPSEFFPSISFRTAMYVYVLFKRFKTTFTNGKMKSWFDEHDLSKHSKFIVLKCSSPCLMIAMCTYFALLQAATLARLDWKVQASVADYVQSIKSLQMSDKKLILQMFVVNEECQ